MQSRRVLKVAEAVREVVSMTILTELKDPRVHDVTVTHVEMSPDLRYAKIHVSIMGDEAKQKLALRGLQSAAGFLQAKVAKRVETRYTPKIEFYLDQGVKRSIEVARILKEVLPPKADEEREDAQPGEGPEPADSADQALDASGQHDTPRNDMQRNPTAEEPPNS